MKTEKVITNPVLAKWLVQKGCKIIDLKPNRYNKIATVFVFEYDKKLEKELKEYQYFLSR
jgi:hypothetical protein